MNSFGLEDKEISLLVSVLESNPQIDKAVIFGSRAMGINRNNSDIDIALFGKEKIDDYFVQSQMDALPLPYEFDVKDYNSIQNSKLKEHIDRVGREIFIRR